MTKKAGKKRRAGKGAGRSPTGLYPELPDIFAAFADLANEAAQDFADQGEDVSDLKQLSDELRDLSRE